jgi:hypothetical protein
MKKYHIAEDVNHIRIKENSILNENKFNLNVNESIFNNAALDMAETDNSNVILIDNMDDSKLCDNSDLVMHDFNYTQDWGYTGETNDTPEEYDGKIYYDNYHRRYIIGKDSYLELDYTNTVKSFINSDTFPIETDSENGVDVIPYIGAVRVLIDTINDDESNIDITLSLIQGSKSASFDLKHNTITDINVSSENNEIVLISDDVKYFITIQNTSDHEIFIKNLAIGFIINELAQNIS